VKLKLEEKGEDEASTGLKEELKGIGGGDCTSVHEVRVVQRWERVTGAQKRGGMNRIEITNLEKTTTPQSDISKAEG